MRICSLLKPELEDQEFGSSFDPVLNGVAQGLARMFPPVETVRLSERDESAAWQSEVDSDATDE